MVLLNEIPDEKVNGVNPVAGLERQTMLVGLAGAAVAFGFSPELVMTLMGKVLSPDLVIVTMLVSDANGTKVFFTWLPSVVLLD
jgi:hypothetical protein